MIKKYTYKFVKKTIANKNGKLISTIYKNTNEKLDVKCNVCKVIWHPTFHSILKGSWCPKCAGKMKHTFYEVCTTITNKNGTLISKEYKDARTNLIITCNVCNNIWHPTYDSVLAGTWCPQCASATTQNTLFNVLLDILNGYKIEACYRGFEWLTNKMTLELDFWIPELKLGIEYDGKQHFVPVCFGGIDIKEAKNKFKKQKKLDKIKDEKISQHKDEIKYFIRIPYTEKITKENITKILKDNGISI